MTALIVFQRDIPNIRSFINFFNEVRFASLSKNNNAHYLPSEEITTSTQGVNFLSQIEEVFNFDVIIFSNEILPKEIASVFAGKYGLGIISHVSGFEKKDKLSFIVYSWKNLGLTIESKTKPTILISNFEIDKSNLNIKNPKVIDIKMDDEIKLIGFESFEYSSKIKTKIAIGVGLGVERELLPVILDIGEKIQAEVVCTRPIADLGLFSYERVVGDTGKQLETNLYIALGISGATQHLSGVTAERIIAVNIDPSARIFEKASIRIKDKVENVIPGVFAWAKNF